MKIAHSVVVTPGRCGLYETTRELARSLRDVGMDSRLVDPTREKNQLFPGGDEDRGVPFADEEWAETADVLVNHSGLGQRLESCEVPVILVAHGRPRSSFLLEVNGGPPVYSYHYAQNKDPRLRAVVTFWPQHIPHLKVMFPDKQVLSVPAPVDLNAWTPQGPAGYKFGDKGGDINVVITDAWREDVDPFDAVMAFALWARHQEGAKLHIYGNNKKRRGWSAIIRRIQDDGNMGEWRGWVKGLAHVYRAASMLITPHIIDTRTVREAMACGCPVVRILDVHRDQTRMTFARNAGRQAVRAEAEQRFNPHATAREFLGVVMDAVRKAA